jgi:hypothetical protein
MRNFKTVALFIILMVIVENLFTFMLEPVTYKHQLNEDLRVEKAQGITPDMVVIGDSTIRSGLDPRILKNRIPGIHCVLNAGTSSQSLCGTYFYLKDILKKYDIKIAVVGISYWQLMNARSTALKKEFIVLDRISDPFIRAEYIHERMTVEELPFLLKSRQYCGNFPILKENLKTKLSMNYLKEKNCNPENVMMGYAPLNEEIGEGHVGIEEGEWDGLQDRVDPEAIEYLRKIINLCKRNKVEVHLVSMPLMCGIAYSNRPMEVLHNKMEKFAYDNQLAFDDMNLLKFRQEIIPDEKMNSADHLSGKTAEQFTEVYAKILVNEQNKVSNSEYMYNSLKAAKNAMSSVLAVDFHTESAEGGARKIIARSIVKENCVPEYRYSVISEAGKEHILQEYSTLNECILPPEYVGINEMLIVECRVKGTPGAKSMRYFMKISKNTWE